MSTAPRARLLLGLMFVLGACSGETDGGVSGPTPSTEVDATAGSSPASAVAEILDAIVLAESDPPTGMVFDAEDLGEAARDHLLSISPSEIHQAVEQGWVDAVLRQWWTPEIFQAVNAGTVEEFSKNFKRSGNWTVLSGASAYEDAESAAPALEAYLEDYRANWELREAGKARLGGEGAIFEGPNPIGGAPQVVYVWRAGPYILHVLATGSVEADADQIRAIAEGMQARADAAG